MLYNLFLSDEELQNNAFTKAGDLEKNQFVADGKLNMHLILQRFIETYTEICGPYYSNVSSEELKDAYSVYGTDLFKRLG